MLDIIGYSTLPDDAKVAASRLDAFFIWLLGVPWWAVTGFALISTMWLIWVSWRPSDSGMRQDNAVDKLSHDIAFQFDDQSDRPAFLGLSRSGNEEVYVQSFGTSGRNLTDSPIKQFSGFFQSDVTNKSYPIYFVIEGLLCEPTDTYGIPANARFNITSAPFLLDNPDRLGIPESQFRVEFASSRLVISYDGKEYIRKFSELDIDANLRWFHEDIDPQKSTKPRVTAKPGAKLVYIDSLRKQPTAADGAEAAENKASRNLQE